VRHQKEEKCQEQQRVIERAVYYEVDARLLCCMPSDAKQRLQILVEEAGTLQNLLSQFQSLV